MAGWYGAVHDNAFMRIGASVYRALMGRGATEVAIMNVQAFPAFIARLVSLQAIALILICPAHAAPAPQEVCEAQPWDRPVEALMTHTEQTRPAHARFDSVLDRPRPARTGLQHSARDLRHLIIPLRRKP